MYKFFVKENQIEDGKITIKNDDVNHIKNVLRLGVGEQIEISNSVTGESYSCEILEIRNNTVSCEVI